MAFRSAGIPDQGNSFNHQRIGTSPSPFIVPQSTVNGQQTVDRLRGFLVALVVVVLLLVGYVGYHKILTDPDKITPMTICPDNETAKQLSEKLEINSKLTTTINESVTQIITDINNNNNTLNEMYTDIENISSSLNINTANITNINDIIETIKANITEIIATIDITDDVSIDNWIGGINIMSDTYIKESLYISDYDSIDDDTPNDEDVSRFRQKINNIKKWVRERKKKNDRVKSFKLAFPNVISNEPPHLLNPSDCLPFTNSTHNVKGFNNLDDGSDNNEEWCNPNNLKHIEHKMNWIEFKLRGNISVTTFEYRHISKDKIPNKFITSKPRCFHFYGSAAGDTYKKLGYGVMKLNDDIFVKEFDNTMKFRYFRMYFTNFGNKYTCIYKVKVNGKLNPTIVPTNNDDISDDVSFSWSMLGYGIPALIVTLVFIGFALVTNKQIHVMIVVMNAIHVMIVVMDVMVAVNHR